MSECWRFCTVPTARLTFTAKTSLDVFNLSLEQLWTFSVLGDRIYEMSRGVGRNFSRGGRFKCLFLKGLFLH